MYLSNNYVDINIDPLIMNVNNAQYTFYHKSY